MSVLKLAKVSYIWDSYLEQCENPLECKSMGLN